MDLKAPLLRKQNVLLLVSCLLIIILVTSLFYTDIGMVSATWDTQKKIEGFKINNATGSLKETLSIYIDPSSLYVDHLRSILSEELTSHLTSTKIIKVLNESSTLNDSSFLGIHVSEKSNHYIPWSSSCEYTIFYYFSDIGNTKYYQDFKTANSMYDNPVINFSASDGEQLLSIGEISIQGSFNGFFSKPRMNDMIVESIGNEIIKEVKK